MAGTAHDQVSASPAASTVTVTPAIGNSPTTAASPPTVAQAKARLLAAAAACDPAPFIQKHPFGSVIGAAAMGVAAAQSPGVQRMITMVMEALLKYSMQLPESDTADKAGSSDSPSQPSSNASASSS